MPIFDQGYQHWKGALSNRFWRWTIIAKQGLRGQFKNWIVRILLLLALMPALLLVTTLAIWGLLEQGTETVLGLMQQMLPPGITADPHLYRQAVWTISYSIFFRVELFFIMLLVLIVGPNLISRDLRYNAFPLYFSRPLTRLDYFMGKLGVIAALVAAVAVLPAAVAYLLGLCFSLDLGVIRDTWRLLPASVLYGLIIVVSAGFLMLALSSLSRRSLYIGIAWIGLWIISTAVAGSLDGINRAMLFNSHYQEELALAKKNEPPDNQSSDAGQGSEKNKKRDRGLSRNIWQRVNQQVEREMAKNAPTNWRPLFSYTANLNRLGEALLNSDAAWVDIGRAIEVPRAAIQPMLKQGLSGKPDEASAQINIRRLADQFVPQYPWIWSAAVLAGLFVLSFLTLSTRVKSLDRLR